jgi:Uma2 family endonuclease
MRLTVTKTAIVSSGSMRPAACVILAQDQEIVVPAKAHNFSGFRDWIHSKAYPEKGRISFLNREIIVDMSQEEIETHGNVKGEVTFTLYGLNKTRKAGRFFPDGTMLTNEEAELAHIPDGSFAFWETLESGRARLVPREGRQGQYMELLGSPDWVMEIVSDSSVRKDWKLLPELYYRAGIMEYWLIDARGKEIKFHVFVHGESGYRPAESVKGWQKSVVFGRSFRLLRRRGRMNLWEYTLEMKSRPTAA